MIKMETMECKSAPPFTSKESERTSLDEVCSQLEDWCAKNIGSFVNDQRGEYLPEVIENIRHACIMGNYPKADVMASWKVKAGTWFRCLMRLHFAGRPTENYTDFQLGLTASEGECGENKIYRAIFQKLRECHGARTLEDYTNFMHSLVNIDLLKDFPVSDITDSLLPGQKIMRPELCMSCSESDEQLRTPYDPNEPDLENYAFYSTYPARVFYFKFHLIRIMLQEAEPSFQLSVIDEWLNSSRYSDIRDWLFSQQYFPLNTFFNECYPWNILIEPLTKLLPEKLNAFDEEFIKDLKEDSKIYLGQEPSPEFFTFSFGRTLKAHPRKGFKNRYLKLQASNETDDFFIRNFRKLCVIRKRQCEFESETVNPVRIARVEKIQRLLTSSGLSQTQKESVLEKTSRSSHLVMEFTTTEGKAYDQYVYDIDSPLEALEALRKYARDYGRLWKKGLLGAPSINAFHHFDGNRKHVTLTPYIGRFNEGSIESWEFHATNFPNVGSVGMRDMGDICTPDEISGVYFDKQSHNPINPETLKKIRLNELARTAEGLILLYARCFNTKFDHTSSCMVGEVQSEIFDILTDLFSHAMPLSRDTCSSLVVDHDLIHQSAREVSYWLASSFPYVKDLRNAEINRAVYPNLPKRMKGCILTEKQKKCLSDQGFIDTSRKQDVHCQLGAQSGRLPLIALNAIITKLLSYGVLEIIREQQGQTSKDALQVSTAKYAA